MALLESAVGRQHVGHGASLKYSDPVASAATLVYGVCNDHPFHNGNKRTALVSMLAHLDKNHLCLYETSQTDVYDLMLAIADHSLGLRVDPRRPDKQPKRRDSDEEVEAIKDWLLRRAAKVTRGEKPITYRHLRQALARFGFEMENTDGNAIDIVRREIQPPTLFRRRPSVKTTRIGTIGYRNEGTEVSLKDLKKVRQVCKLTEEHGVDTDAFYSDAAVVDAFINRYRAVLRRLART